MAEVNIRLNKILNDYVDIVSMKIKVDRVILFGSAAKGNLKNASDVDLIVLSRDFEKMDFLHRLELLSHARRGDARKIPMDILGYTPAEFKKLKNRSTVLNEAMKGGKVIRH